MKVKLKPAFWLQAIRTARKIILYARGGYNSAERKELAGDLLGLAADLLEEIGEDLDGQP
jgi:hypothetical protein